jgi:hypothetical protein
MAKKEDVIKDKKTPFVSADVVKVTQSWDKEIFNRMEKYRRAHGLLSVQEVDRLAVIMFLNKNGY